MPKKENSMKIKINNHVWEVIFFERTDERYDGVTSESDMTIKVNKNLSKQAKKHCLIHELVHAHLDSFGFDNYVLQKMTIEQVCEFVAHNIDSIQNLANKILGEHENGH